jgi:hypothetical protein
MTMRYPSYPSQANSGNLLTGKQGGPPDQRFTSRTAPYYQSKIDARYGRTLAGDNEVQNQATDSPDNAYAVNELELLRALDDVQGDGIFDPPGTHPNIYPDAGSLAARFSLPGYHVREVPFMKSEVRDATTGRPIIPVPNGAVSLDTPAKIAQLEKYMYAPPQPVVWSNRGGQVVDQSIVNWAVNPEQVTATQGLGRSRSRAFGEDAPPLPPTGGKMLLAAISVGLAGGFIYALATKKKGRR